MAAIQSMHVTSWCSGPTIEGMDTKVVLVDPSRDGADVGFAVLDRLKAEMLHRVGLSGLPTPTSRTNEGLSQ
jgi:hypothetical protein